MTDARQTDERLRSWLDARQPERERMSAAILGIDGRFSNIELRRPDGGPDGGRDIQCVFNGADCFGAVGFKNKVNDSDQQKREISQKFEDDLSVALEAKPNLKAFVFLTNVDLTPGEQSDLKRKALDRGIVEIEVFNRERLRLLLDSPEGFAARFTFLDIPLSDAEQKVFFSRFGAEIQSLISGRLDSLEELIEEIQFVNWRRSNRCRAINIVIRLKEPYRVDGTNHTPYRFAVHFCQPLFAGEGEILIGCYSELVPGERFTEFRPKRFIYTDTELIPAQRKQHTSLDPSVYAHVAGQALSEFQISCSFESKGAFLGNQGIDLRLLNTHSPDFFCDSAWAPRVKDVEVWFDDYLVWHWINHGELSRFDRVEASIPNWPDTGDLFNDLPVHHFHGWGLGIERRCRRKRVDTW